jgi:hypothetical protein
MRKPLAQSLVLPLAIALFNWPKLPAKERPKSARSAWGYGDWFGITGEKVGKVAWRLPQKGEVVSSAPGQLDTATLA